MRGYTTDSLAVIVRKAPCDTGRPTPVYPAFLSSDPLDRPRTAELRAFVNADPARVSASVVDGADRLVGTGQCAAAGGGIQIAYATECSIALTPSLQGDYKLRLDEKERFRTASSLYPLSLR